MRSNEPIGDIYNENDILIAFDLCLYKPNDYYHW